MASFNTFNTVNPTNCYICFEDLRTDVVCHTDGGDLHPVHRKCIRAWAETQQMCPVCMVRIDVNSLYSRNDRVISMISAGLASALNKGIVAFMVIAELSIMLVIAAAVVVVALFLLMGAVVMLAKGGEPAMEVVALAIGSLFTYFYGERLAARFVGRRPAPL